MKVAWKVSWKQLYNYGAGSTTYDYEKVFISEDSLTALAKAFHERSGMGGVVSETIKRVERVGEIE